MSPHNDKSFAVICDVREASETLETATKDATLHEMLIGKEVLSHFLHVSPEVFSQSIPHVGRIVLRSSRHGVNVLDHLQDG